MSSTKKLSKRIFLDYASATPIDGEVLKQMDKHNSVEFANPSAIYNDGIYTKEKVVSSRVKIADILNCKKEEIIFTSGGTESNNLALLGLFERHKTKDFTPHMITTTIEHPSILEVCNEIERRGGRITKIPVSQKGIVNLKDIQNAITRDTILVSIMYANNEIGTIQPIKEIGRMIKEYRIKNNVRTPYFHTDACQAGLYLPLDVSKLNVDLLTLDGLKIHGPRGIGILYIRNLVEINPIHFGGGQENGLRSGTENVGAIVGMACALEIGYKMREKESSRLVSIRDYAIKEILRLFKGTTLNGSEDSRLPNNINICFPGLDSEFAVISLDVLGISSSYSSSCLTLKEDSSSYVVGALQKENCTNSSLRFSLGRGSKKSDIDYLINALKRVVK